MTDLLFEGAPMSGIAINKVKSLIIGADRSFRSQVARLLTDIAFVGDKVYAATTSEATAIIDNDTKVVNICVDGESLDDVRLRELLQAVSTSTNKKGHCKTLVYLRGAQERMQESLVGEYPHFVFKLVPIKKSDFVETFLSARKTKDLAAAPVVEKAEAPKPAEASAAPSPARDANVQNFFETTQHIRVCIDAATKITMNREDLASLALIGQRFNGIVGTFAILKHKPGYKQLFELSTIIDDLCRAYQNNPGWKAVTPPHLDLLMRSVKCAFLTLKDLRDSQPPTAEQMTEAAALFELYTNATDIPKRESHSQADVDALLSELKTG